MEIHNDPPARMIDMHIRRGDVRRRDFRQQVVRDCDAAPLRPRLKLSELLGRDVRRLGQQTRLGQMEATRGVYRPWPDQLIGVGKPNVAALMVGEIEVVVAKPTLNPIGSSDHRRSLDIDTDTRVQARCDYWLVEQSLNAHFFCPDIARPMLNARG